MSETRERVYNVPYGTYNAQKGLSASLFHRLKRFALDRQQVTFELLDPGQRFLDIGCGFGGLVTLAKIKFDEVYGIDFCIADIERCQQSIETRADKEKIHFLNHDVEKGLPFDDSFFDAVSLISVLEHI
jgi:ubiquinone/menaquinone biosynthesis C-methylase UbiE